MNEKLNFTTLTQMLDFVHSSYENPQAFNFLENGKWKNISTTEFVEKVKFLALALREIGFKKNDSFGIISYPGPIWLMVDFAAIAADGISVPIFPNIAPQNLLFEIENSDMEFIFCDSQENLNSIKNCGKKFEKIIIYGFEAVGEGLINFSDLLEIGRKIFEADSASYSKLTANISENDLAAIIYTSGSTGVPKGVEITHKNLVSQIKGAAEFFPLYSEVLSDGLPRTFGARNDGVKKPSLRGPQGRGNPSGNIHDLALSFLPLAHIFERMVVSYYIASGISIYFVNDVNNLGNIIKEIKPTLMTVVPRVLEKVYKKMRSGVDENGFVKKIIGHAAFDLALKSDVEKFRKTLLGKIFDHLVYKKLRMALGGRFRMMICGGAALSDEMNRFFTNIGVTLYIGYGATESSPVIAANNYKFHKFGTVGKPFPEIEVKLNSKGELLARGPNVMRGYHNDPQKTSEVIDKEGWLNTGDLAEIDEENYIKIIGRAKELFKTSGGKYISPVPIEQAILNGCEFLMAVSIIAEGKKFVSCLLFVDFEILEKCKNKFGMIGKSDEEFLNSDLVNKKISRLITSVNSNLNKWEQIQKYYLVKDKISVETGELTPSMKLRRNVVEEKYKKVIDKFYED